MTKKSEQLVEGGIISEEVARASADKESPKETIEDMGAESMGGIPKSEFPKKIWKMLSDKDSENEQLKSENEQLKSENAALKERLTGANNSREYQEFIENPQNKKEFDELVNSMGIKECPHDQRQAVVDIIIQRRK